MEEGRRSTLRRSRGTFKLGLSQPAIIYLERCVSAAPVHASSEPVSSWCRIHRGAVSAGWFGLMTSPNKNQYGIIKMGPEPAARIDGLGGIPLGYDRVRLYEIVRKPGIAGWSLTSLARLTAR